MVIIDGSSILYRSYYGLPDQLKNERGESTGAIVGFMNELLKEKNDHSNEKIIIVLDRGGRSKRKEKYADYKNNRQTIPDELLRQANVIKALLKCIGIEVVHASDGAEGDDAIGTLTKLANESVRIITVDADMLQLLDSNTNVELLKKNKRELYDVARFESEFGFKPTSFVDYKALFGDKSDNIPGVNGIGEKTAKRLIQTYGNLDDLYKYIYEIKSAKLKEQLISGKENAYLSRELAKIDNCAEIEIIEAAENEIQAKTICEEEGLLSLIVRLYGKPELEKLPEYEISGKYVYRLKSAIKAGEIIDDTKYDLELMAYVLDPERGVKKLESQLAVKGRLLENIGRHLEDNLIASDEMKLYETIELPLIKILADMEERGVKVNLEQLKAENTVLTKELTFLETEIYETAGRVFNLNSSQQLGKILFEVMGIAPLKKTKSGYSTDAEVLRQLEDQYPIVRQVQRYRQIFKLKRTYLDGIEKQLDSNCRVHTTFNQTQTATGRLSSSDPNLQNIPIRTQEGKAIRRLFEAGDGYDYLLSADYSQIELRILAHLSEDQKLIEAFNSDEDIHSRTAEEVFGDASLRNRAKAINYGIVYGLSDYGLAKQLLITRKEAGDYIEQYFNKYSGVKNYMNRLIDESRQRGYVETMYNRRRQLPGLESRNNNARHLAERQAMNTPIQGSAADIIKLAMIAVDNQLKKGGFTSRMLLQVHDELLLEVTKSEIESVTDIVRREMESVAKMKVPLKVDIHFAHNWADAK
ncbi:MAG: DNA polymerase I [Selenomonadaceae bacterium]|nr:DNA polymerase I [Selenomonadaceae bacterium]